MQKSTSGPLNCAFFNRKKGWVVRTYVEKIRGSVTHMNSPLIRRVTGEFLPFIVLGERESSDAGNERERVR